MARLASRCAAARPEVAVVVTPHGIHLEGRFAVVTAGRLSGSLGGEAPAATSSGEGHAQSAGTEGGEGGAGGPPISLTVATDRDLAQAVLVALRAAGLPACGVSFGGNVPGESVMPLDWGGLIPLWFLGGRSDPPLPAVLVAPARDLTLEQHVRAGAAIAQAAAASGRRVSFVASADQAHAHRRDGPYGFDPAAASFDRLAVELVKADRLERLLELTPATIAAAKPDSVWQMLLLHGALAAAGHWQPEFLAYAAPTYYGMLVAAYLPAVGAVSPSVRPGA
jgi:aromatic ring-opening dioxygenase LigB subunit